MYWYMIPRIVLLHVVTSTSNINLVNSAYLLLSPSSRLGKLWTFINYFLRHNWTKTCKIDIYIPDRGWNRKIKTEMLTVEIRWHHHTWWPDSYPRWHPRLWELWTHGWHCHHGICHYCQYCHDIARQTKVFQIHVIWKFYT